MNYRSKFTKLYKSILYLEPIEMDTLSGPEGHKRNKWSEAHFDPVFFQAESSLEVQRGFCQRDVGHGCAETHSPRMTHLLAPKRAIDLQPLQIGIIQTGIQSLGV